MSPGETIAVVAGGGVYLRLSVPERLLRLPENIPTVWQTRTLVSDLTCASGGPEVALAPQPDDDWLRVNRAGGGDVPADVLTAVVDGEVVFASIPGVATGRAAVQAPDGSRWLGLFTVFVAEDQRRRGYGRAICAALQAWGVQHGATRGYTQVPATDPAVFGFFEAVGFTGQHRTRYLDAGLLRP